VAALELPAAWGGLVDLPSEVDERTAARLRGVLGGTEDQVAIRAAGVFGRRLTHAPAATVTRSFRPTGTVLITGGTGGVGSEVARWAAAQGAEHLVLTSRRGLDAPGATALADELRSAGARVTVAACDVADRDAVAALLADIPHDAPLTAVFHAAGGIDHDAEVRELDRTGLAALFGAKVAGAWHLHELAGELADFVVFSSGAGVWGSGRQPGYAAANASLDALAEFRRAAGLPATSVAWGAWAKVGIAAQAENDEQLNRRGVLPMDPALAVTALRVAIEDGAATSAVTNMDWARFAPSFTAQRPSPLLDDLPEVRALAEPVEVDQVERGVLLSKLDGLRPAERERELLELVRAEAGVVLGFGAGESLPATRPFKDFGLDSVTAIELRNRLRTVTGLTLPGGVVFDYPTANALATHLLTELYPEHAAAPADPDAEIRALLASIPVGRLRKAGVLDMVLSLASESDSVSGTVDGTDAATNGDSLDDLDGEDLLRLAGEISN
jgi:NAD(P)-dependent dehydrogenase (short-subunit alcohol dehydrogenase family)